MATAKILPRIYKDVTQSTSGFSFNRSSIPSLQENSQFPDFIKEYTSHSYDLYEKIPFPGKQDEAWRRTDLKELKTSIFALPGSENGFKPEKIYYRKGYFKDKKDGSAILIQGDKSRNTIGTELISQGVVFSDFHSAQLKYPDLLEQIIGKIVPPEDGKFAALASALATNGVFLYVPKNVQLDQPVYSLYWGPGSHLAYFSHLIIWLEEGSSATYLHEYASPDEADQSMHSGIVEIFVGKGANLKFIELQSWGKHIWNFTHERAKIDQEGCIDWVIGSIGSHLTKNFSTIDLIGRGATGRMSGFYFTNNDQHLDHDTQQNHLAPNTTSDLLFKGALKDKSRSVWQGMIYVAPGADKTDGYQANRNLVLSPKARADSIPGLEILANDVRCTHGATVGKIDENQMFYLLTRGISPLEAKRLIVEGFFDPMMQRIPVNRVKSRFQRIIKEKLDS